MRNYLDLLNKIERDGEDVQSGAVIQSEARKATCRFLLAQQLRFDLRKGFPAVTTKKLLFDWVVDEVLWFLRGETNINTLGRNVDGQFVKRPIWDQWAREDGEVPRVYGEQWRRWTYAVNDYDQPLGVDNYDLDPPGLKEWDQVGKLVADLKAVRADPGNRARRRIILSAWNPPMIPEMGLPPCHTLSQWLPTNGYLDVVCTCRSIDTFTGMPFNIAQYAILATIFGMASGLIPRELVLNVVDCHIYDNQHEQIKQQTAREPLGTPTIMVDDRFFKTAPDLSIEQLKRVDPSWIRLEGYEYHKGQLKAEVAV